MAEPAVLLAKPATHQAHTALALKNLQGMIKAARIQDQIVIEQDQHLAAGLAGQVVHVAGEVVGLPNGDAEGRPVGGWGDRLFTGLAAIPGKQHLILGIPVALCHHQAG